MGASSPSRIAQACDRCRSKKIRCDGVKPCCSQCANAGFECKTSDKLSRRAFPRGYTRSLEHRVRGLEAEVRELKQLLDEKDEKIDMLSWTHSFSPVPRNGSHPLSPPSSANVEAEAAAAIHKHVLHVEIPAPVQTAASSTGTLTTSAFIEAFEGNVQEQGHPCQEDSLMRLPCLQDIAPEDDHSSSSTSDRSSGTSTPARQHSTLRSRTGCWICRERKVKCDEGRPICGRCSRFRRTCDYNVRLSIRDDTARVVARMQDVTVGGSFVWDGERSTHAH